MNKNFTIHILLFSGALLISLIWERQDSYENINVERMLESHKLPVEDAITRRDTFKVPYFLKMAGYVHFKKKDADTVYEFTFTDNIQNSQLHVLDEIRCINDSNYFNNVRYASLHKTYPDRKHTYKADDGKILPLPVSKILNRYDRIGKSGWMHIDYANYHQEDWKENRDKIVAIDSCINENGVTEIYLYYQVWFIDR